jgi:EAL domain-containing protein (putative c-di-GMP-specific phosphodiesterase class I)
MRARPAGSWLDARESAESTQGLQERMSSTAPLQTSFPVLADCEAPYETYAELLRMLVPDVRKICFYDRSSRASWISDGVDELSLKVMAGLVLSQADDSIRQSHTSTTADGMRHVTTVHALDDSVKGVLALEIGRRRYGKLSMKLQPTDLDMILAPVLRILGHALDKPGQSVQPRAVPPPIAPSPVQHAPFVGAAARATSIPVLLRRTLSNAVVDANCAFGALVTSEHQLTFVQRGNQSQGQFDMRGIVDALHQPLTELIYAHNEPVTTSPAVSWVELTDHKFIACPVHRSDGGLVAVLMLLRRTHERDFDSSDRAALRYVATQAPTHVIDRLAPLLRQSESVQCDDAVAVEQPIAPETPSPTLAEPSMEQRLRTALRNEGFALHVQSIAPLRELPDTARYEVLVRLREGDTLQLPEMFMPAAADVGLLSEIDRWVISRLLKAIRPHAEALCAGKWEFALNVSAASLQRADFGDFIEAQLFRSTVPASALVFEFSECAALAHQTMFVELAKRLNALGCRIALDNCRQGLDIFFSIANLSVQRLKIDAALTQHLASDSRAAQTVRELLEVTSDVGIETVGEHIEDEATCQLVRELGIDFAQGFNVSQPQPLMELFN